MKRFLTLILAIIIFMIPIAAYCEYVPMASPEIIWEEVIENIGDDENDPNQNVDVIDPNDEPKIIEYDYEIGLDNLSKYNIVALNDADINQHIRGSIWVGGTLTGNQYIDDGALNGTPASDSYVYNNMSQLVFKSRTQYQSNEAFFLLSYKAVENTRAFWFDLMEDLVNGDEHFEYVAPDKNGHVDLKLWNYKAEGGDETKQTISKVYWTDATTVEMGGLGGHLIAPYADIYVVSCNFRGSVVGWNIIIDGEAHINYYTFEKPEPEEKATPTPTPTATPTVSPTPTISPTPSESPTPSPTPTETPSPTPTLTPTPTPTSTPRPTIPTTRPTPGPHIVPVTGDEGFLVPLIIFVLAIGCILIIVFKRKK